ncbi:MAG: hypothetical protein KAT15_13155, partial [Bacteroidales bacterium]|nr:hypothetical protein [Bacteroidales bacterium]
MRYLLPTLFILVAGLNATGQDRNGIREGKISFITTQSVYVKFSSMELISEGDTLYIKQGEIFVPALQIKNLSSMSCVCNPLVTRSFKVSEAVYAKLDPGIITDTIREEVIVAAVQPDEIPESDSLSGDSLSGDAVGLDKMKREIHGRISVSSYSNFSSTEAARRQRMRYTFSINANNLGNSGFSAESYLSFVHTNTNWEDIKDNIFRGLKIYNLSIKYDFNETMYLSVGRKINPKLSSVGAIDGIQFEKKFSFLTLGVIAGSRPDYKDYSINLDLLQYGVYLGHELQKDNVSMQTSLAFIEQTNHSITDRRFVYFQHSSWLMKNLFFFASAEMDLYKKVNDTIENTFNLSNVYLSLRYRIIRQLSVGFSYSSRQNVIYYETYKDFVERLLENEALQGWRFRINARPVKYLVLGVNAGYRYRKEDPRPSKNVYGYATYSKVPGIKASLTLSATWLETSYLNGNIYSLGLSREILPGKLNGG